MDAALNLPARLLRAIDNGSVTDLRAHLAALPGSDGAQHAERADDEVDGAGEKSTSNARRGLVNVICSKRKKSALYLAVQRGQCEIARELLNHGADPLWEWRLVQSTGSETALVGVSCLDQAVNQGNVEMAKLLMRYGAVATYLAWQKVTEFSPDRFFDVLVGDGCFPIPLFVVADVVARSRWSGVRVKRLNWRIERYNCGNTLERLLMSTEFAYILSLPATGLVQHFGKSLAVQLLFLYGIKLPKWLFDASKGPVILEAGASIDGWTCGHTMAMIRAWRYLENNPQCWEKGCKAQLESQGVGPPPRKESNDFWLRMMYSKDRHRCLSCQSATMKELKLEAEDFFDTKLSGGADNVTDYTVERLLKKPKAYSLSMFSLLPAVMAYASGSAEALQEILLSRSKAALLDMPERIPMAVSSDENDHDYELHDGSTCCDHAELSAEQKKISLMMCTCSGGTVQSLMSLCRDVITTACLEHTENVFFAVESLPLPVRMKCYLLGN